MFDVHLVLARLTVAMCYSFINIYSQRLGVAGAEQTRVCLHSGALTIPEA